MPGSRCGGGSTSIPGGQGGGGAAPPGGGSTITTINTEMCFGPGCTTKCTQCETKVNTGSGVVMANGV